MFLHLRSLMDCEKSTTIYTFKLLVANTCISFQHVVCEVCFASLIEHQ